MYTPNKDVKISEEAVGLVKFLHKISWQTIEYQFQYKNTYNYNVGVPLAFRDEIK